MKQTAGIRPRWVKAAQTASTATFRSFAHINHFVRVSSAEAVSQRTWLGAAHAGLELPGRRPSVSPQAQIPVKKPFATRRPRPLRQTFRSSLALLSLAAALVQAGFTPTGLRAQPAPVSAPADPAAVPGAAAYAGTVKVTRLLKTQADAAGRPIAYPTDGPAEITAVLVEIPPGGRTGWHKHPLPCVGYILEGRLDVTLIDGRVNVFKAGEAIAETVDLEHEGVNPGPGAAKLVMFVLGTEGKAFTVKTPGPATP